MTDSVAKELGERVREVRRAKRLTQIELAQRADVSRDALVRLELGQRKTRASTIRKIAAALGVDSDAFGVKEPTAAGVFAMSAPPREGADGEGTPRVSAFEGERHNVIEGIVSRDPGVMGGAVVFVGTRVPVEIFVDYLVAGDTLERFLRDFPTVSYEQAVGYLRMTPEAVGKIMTG